MSVDGDKRGNKEVRWGGGVENIYEEADNKHDV